MELTNILDICDVIYEYGTYISINEIVNDTNIDKKTVSEVLSLLTEYEIIENNNNKYKVKMEYSDAYDTIISKYK